LRCARRTMASKRAREGLWWLHWDTVVGYFECLMSRVDHWRKVGRFGGRARSIMGVVCFVQGSDFTLNSVLECTDRYVDDVQREACRLFFQATVLPLTIEWW